MKRSLLRLSTLALMLMLLPSCKPKVDVAKEKDAIMAVINGETQSYIDKNIEKVKSFYIQDEFQTRLATGCGTFDLRSGWNSIKSMIDSAEISMAPYENIKYSKEFITIKVMGNVAWAIYKETATADFNKTPMTANNMNVMVLEKMDGNWKISAFFLHDLTPPPPPPPPVEKKK
jgi:hypothetical protein